MALRERGFRWGELKTFLRDHGIDIGEDVEHVVIDVRMGVFARVYTAGEDAGPLTLTHAADAGAPKKLRVYA